MKFYIVIACALACTVAAETKTLSPSNEKSWNAAVAAAAGEFGSYYITRSCPSCRSDYKTIVYKRISRKSINSWDTMVRTWRGACPPGGIKGGTCQSRRIDRDPNMNNVMNVDFELYSNLADAEAGINKWNSCNFNHNTVGFPRDCGRTGLVGGQWNGMTNSGRFHGKSVTWTVTPGKRSCGVRCSMHHGILRITHKSGSEQTKHSCSASSRTECKCDCEPLVRPLIGSSAMALTRNKKLATVAALRDYELSFDIFPKGHVGDWSNILHFTDAANNNNIGTRGRMPGIWFHGHSTRLHFRMSTRRANNIGCDPSDNLPINKWSTVSMTAKKGQVNVFYNGVKKCNFVVNEKDLWDTKNLKLDAFVSDGWYHAAKANLRNLVYRELSN